MRAKGGENVDKDVCIFCGNPVSAYHNCKVCYSCKTVSNFALSADELYAEARSCISSIQHYLESIAQTLLEIEDRHCRDKGLLPKERCIREFCISFQSCKCELEHMLAHAVRINNLLFRQKLFELLELSVEFQNVFDHECHVLSISK
jgi:hypothetical protein